MVLVCTFPRPLAKRRLGRKLFLTSAYFAAIEFRGSYDTEELKGQIDGEIRKSPQKGDERMSR